VAETGTGTGIQTPASVIIAGPAGRVWEGLTNPAILKERYFVVDVEADWRPGSPVLRRGMYQRKVYEGKDTVVGVDPPRRLVHTHWSEFSGLPDGPENCQRVTALLSDRDGQTELTVREYNLPSEGAKLVSDRASPVVLGELKELLEG
jgi:uncharacterized protein YndB with AHSA1/START domain